MMIVDMMLHTAAARLEHIEKHVAEARAILNTSADVSMLEKVGICQKLQSEFLIMRSDADMFLLLMDTDNEITKTIDKHDGTYHHRRR